MAHSPVQIYAAVSIDGYLATADGGVAWLERFESGGDDLGYDAFFADVGSLVLGRTTYDQVLGFGSWPYAGKPTAVLTSRPLDPDPPPGVIADDGSDLAGLVDRLRATPGNVWLVGGGEVFRSFLAAGLADELWLFVMPVLLGDGIATLPAPMPERWVRLTEARPYPSGAVLLRYAVRQTQAG